MGYLTKMGDLREFRVETRRPGERRPVWRLMSMWADNVQSSSDARGWG